MRYSVYHQNEGGKKGERFFFIYLQHIHTKRDIHIYFIPEWAL